MLRKIFICCFLSCFHVLNAQKDSLKKHDRYYFHKYENDFFTSTDRYYTQGVYLELIFPVFRKLPFSKTLIPLGKHALNYYGLSHERQGFTPRSIRYNGLYYGERPYAAVAYITHSLVSILREERLKLTTRFSIGCMGPNLRGAVEQRELHSVLDNLPPLGWEYQIENDYVLNYDLFLEKGIVSTNYFELTGIAEARTGTLYTDLSLGSMIRIGWMQPYFNNLGLTRQKNVQKFQYYLYIRGRVKAVGYNATMQGGLINRNSCYTIPDSDIARIVGNVYYGMVVTYKKVALEFSKADISPEFSGGLNHGWGRVAVSVCF